MPNFEEEQYLNLLREILNNGIDKPDRTGVGTRYIFSHYMKFSLRDQFPIITTKKVFWKGAIEELLFFMRGDTNSKHLEERGVNIWKGNTSREFLDKRGLNYLPEGEIGCTYSHQWRNFGGEHPLVPETKGLKGFDQLQYIIDTLKTNPFDRRLVLNGWNPLQHKYACLPSCHMVYTFNYNPKDNSLNCNMLQRSVDSLLGLVINISSLAAMTYIIAKIVNMTPGEISWTGVDCHIYNNHIDAAKLQIQREPRQFPKLNIKKDIRNLNDLNTLSYKDFELIGYNPHPTIKVEMAI